MTQLRLIWHSFINLATNLLITPDWHTILDILIMSVIIYNILKVLMQTRANSVIKGLGFLAVVTWLSEVLQLNTLNWVLQQMLGAGFIMLVILFQPELRRGLEQIGRSRFSFKRMLNAPIRQEKEAAEKDIQNIILALKNMSRKRIGALIVFEGNTGLQDVIETGTHIDAEISQPLIENIFEPNTPLHDGAMIITNRRITAAACILQLSNDFTISRELGTRHRAALGISETTDALTLIVSEETGIISMTKNGKITRHLNENTLNEVLSNLLIPAEKETNMSLRSWILKKKEVKADVSETK